MFRWNLACPVVTLCAMTACTHSPTARHSFDQLASVAAEPLRHRWTPAELTHACAEIEQRATGRLAELVAIPDAQRTFENSFKAFEDITSDYGDAAGRLNFLKDVHTDEAIRAASAECEEREHKYLVALGARKDLYLAMNAALEHFDVASLDPQDRRLVEFTKRDTQRACRRTRHRDER